MASTHESNTTSGPHVDTSGKKLKKLISYFAQSTSVHGAADLSFGLTSSPSSRRLRLTAKCGRGRCASVASTSQLLDRWRCIRGRCITSGVVEWRGGEPDPLVHAARGSRSSPQGSLSKPTAHSRPQPLATSSLHRSIHPTRPEETRETFHRSYTYASPEACKNEQVIA